MEEIRAQIQSGTTALTTQVQDLKKGIAAVADDAKRAAFEEKHKDLLTRTGEVFRFYFCVLTFLYTAPEILKLQQYKQNFIENTINFSRADDNLKKWKENRAAEYEKEFEKSNNATYRATPARVVPEPPKPVNF